MESIVQSFGPLIAFALVLLFVDMLIPSKKEMRRRRRAKERRQKQKYYQDRRLANDAEHARVTREMRYEVLRRDGFRCVRCGRSAADGVKLHVDHVVPVSRGGRSEMSNLQTLCEDCNLGKGNAYME